MGEIRHNLLKNISLDNKHDEISLVYLGDCYINNIEHNELDEYSKIKGTVHNEKICDYCGIINGSAHNEYGTSWFDAYYINGWLHNEYDYAKKKCCYLFGEKFLKSKFKKLMSI